MSVFVSWIGPGNGEKGGKEEERSQSGQKPEPVHQSLISVLHIIRILLQQGLEAGGVILFSGGAGGTARLLGGCDLFLTFVIGLLPDLIPISEGCSKQGTPEGVSYGESGEKRGNC